MNERIRCLREELGLSRAAFGQKIGVSGDVINNLERGRVEIKEPMIKLICSEFSINEEWLRTGIGEMKVKSPSDTMEQLKREFGLDDFSYNLVYQYLKLDAEQRQTVRDFFYNVVETGVMDEDLFGDVPKTPEDLEKGISAGRTRTEQRNGLGVKPPGLYLKSYQINKYIFVLPLNLKL